MWKNFVIAACERVLIVENGDKKINLWIVCVRKRYAVHTKRIDMRENRHQVTLKSSMWKKNSKKSESSRKKPAHDMCALCKCTMKQVEKETHRKMNDYSIELSVGKELLLFFSLDVIYSRLRNFLLYFFCWACASNQKKETIFAANHWFRWAEHFVFDTLEL